MSDSRQGAVTDPRRQGLPETVVCLGSSTTASKGTYKWIDELEKRPQNKRFRFVNLGVGGDLSFNTVGLLDRVVALQPDRVIVLIGTNDIMATVFPNFRRFVRIKPALRRAVACAVRGEPVLHRARSAARRQFEDRAEFAWRRLEKISIRATPSKRGSTT